MFKMLPPVFQEETKNNDFLMDYIHLIPVEEVGIPEFYEELARDLGEKKNPNLIYRIGGGLYVHIYPDPADSRDYYIAIVPGMFDSNAQLIEQMEDRLVDHVEELEDPKNKDLNQGEVL